MRKKIHVCVFKWKQYDCWWNHQRFLGYYTNHRFWWLNQNMSRLNHHYCCLYPHLGLLNRHFRWLNNHCYCLLVGGLEHFLCFHSVGNFIIPTDELIFLRGAGIPPTRYSWFMIVLPTGLWLFYQHKTTKNHQWTTIFPLGKIWINHLNSHFMFYPRLLTFMNIHGA